jgi:hypothetical protein
VKQQYGKVTDLATSEILPGQKSVCLTTKFNPMGTVNTDDKGNYTFSVEWKNI